MCANICTKRDLKDLCEVEDYETGAFIRSTFTYVDEQDIAWFGRTADKRKYHLTVEDLNRLLQEISDEKIYPLKNSSISMAKLLPQITLEEAKVLEFLKQHPHPNIVKYHGCTVNRGYITGIALEKYEIILQYRFEDVPHDLDIVACMDGIRKGVKHLHLLGYAHNDLNPTNIAIDSDDNPIILDFGSCRRFGEKLLTAGTYGWIDGEYATSAQRHDESAINKIEAWLKEEKNKRATMAT
ncbi:uncharacterized protein BDR25DRAFT_235740 [Lindgomyces ingoldianus]|uniref:Uncharacterized protein n=1 Tax=Lindgomyces ingoldianus TaxID=673940 RepID=A0ACB6QJ17_9PLEO|nr:uncharacterized protein BDR25DRAFT_235740 [Lindgomyces ingoldianus]KAF2466993.1 hypothetical protein BDR25DRAFT_235740 [Lindgomyces ingoldianus]